MVDGRGRFGCQRQYFGAGVNDYVFSDGFLLSSSMCKRGFHDLLSQVVFSIDAMWVHFQFYGFSDESVHVSGFRSKDFCAL